MPVYDAFSGCGKASENLRREKKNLRREIFKTSREKKNPSREILGLFRRISFIRFRRSLKECGALLQTFQQGLETRIAGAVSIVLVQTAFLVVNQEERDAAHVQRFAQLVVFADEQLAF